MKYYRKKAIFFYIGLIIVLGTIFILPKGWGITIEKSISSIADKDTYVDTANPTSNYGGTSNLMSGWGIFSDIREAYFHFTFTDKPENVTKAELSLDIWGVSQTMELTLSIIDVSWNEFTLDWITKPVHGQTIGKIIAPSSGIYKFDITSLLTSRTEISICVNMTIDDYVTDYVYITSREGYYSWATEDAPQIIWTFLETVSDSPVDAIPGYDTFFVIGIMIIFGFLLTRKIRNKKALIQ